MDKPTTQTAFLALALIIFSFPAFAQFGPELPPDFDWSEDHFIHMCLEGSATENCDLTYDQCKKWVEAFWNDKMTVELMREADGWCKDVMGKWEKEHCHDGSCD